MTEHTYTKFYADITASVVRMELNMRGLPATQKNRKESKFLESIKEHCRTVFETLLNQPKEVAKKEGESQDDYFERCLKEKQKLFGNIQFLGDLYKQRLVTDSVISQVFQQLLGVGTLDDSTVNDNTIEAALRLINKIGKVLDDKKSEKADDKKKGNNIHATMDKVYDRFRELMEFSDTDPKNRASTRLKYLIKNMFDDRDKGWPKAQLEEKTIQKKDEVARAVQNKDA